MCRAAERREDIIACIQQRGYSKMFDMSSSEASSKYLEGTGALVPDRINGIVYVNLSERADEKLAQQWADQLGYKSAVFFRSACKHELRNLCCVHCLTALICKVDLAGHATVSTAYIVQRYTTHCHVFMQHAAWEPARLPVFLHE